MPGTLAEIRASGAERPVLLSTRPVPDGDMSKAIARYHILSEQAVRESGLPWTFLRPSSFMSNTVQLAASGGRHDSGAIRRLAGGNADARAEMSAAMPRAYVDAFFIFVDGKLDESDVIPTVQEILGRRPRTLEQWAAAHAAPFR